CPVCAPVSLYAIRFTPEPPALSVAVNVTVTFCVDQPDGLPLATVTGGVVSTGGGGGVVVSSSSTIVASELSARSTVRPPLAPRSARASRKASPPSSSVSPLTFTTTCLDFSPAANVSVPLASATSPGTVAVTPATFQSTDTGAGGA